MLNCFLGGLGYVFGPMLGTFVLYFGWDLLFQTGEFQLLIYSTLLIVLMLVLPNGLLSLGAVPEGRAERWPSCFEVSGLTKRFGGLVAVNDVSFSVREREILSVIGPNGAGKSTLFKLISSFLRPTSGEVLLQGRAHLGPGAAHRRPQGRGAHLPGDDDLQEHDACATMSSSPTICAPRPACSASFSAPARRARDEAAFGRSADEILDFLGLSRDRATRSPATCRTAICGRSASPSASPPNPTVLLLDEPFAGMNHDETSGGRRWSAAARARPHRSARRARHAGGHEDLRPHRRPEFRREDRRGNAGRDPGATRRSSRPISAAKTRRSGCEPWTSS